MPKQRTKSNTSSNGDDGPAFNLRPRGGMVPPPLAPTTAAAASSSTTTATSMMMPPPQTPPRSAAGLRSVAKSPRFEPYGKVASSPRTPKGTSLTTLMDRSLGVGEKFLGSSSEPSAASSSSSSRNSGGGVPLENEWSFYFHKYTPGLSVEEYEKSIRKLHTFSSVEGFWSCFNNIPTLKQLTTKSSYHLMKSNIRPLWEDPENVHGGKWCFRVNKEDAQAAWQELALAAIGEQLSTKISAKDQIQGITMSIRDRTVICEIWNKIATEKPEAVMNFVRKILGSIQLTEEFYRPHQQHRQFVRSGN